MLLGCFVRLVYRSHLVTMMVEAVAVAVVVDIDTPELGRILGAARDNFLVSKSFEHVEVWGLVEVVHAIGQSAAV